MAPAGTNRLYRIVYLSSAAGPLFAEKLDRILLRSRVSNRQARISGLLLFQDGRFLHVIEGPEAAVLALAGKIARDRQHRDMRVIASGPCEARTFSEPMAYVSARHFTEAQSAAFGELSGMGAGESAAPADLEGLRVTALIARFREVEAA